MNRLHSILLLIAVLFAGIVYGENPILTDAKQPSYIECFSDKVLIYPGKASVSWDELQHPDNAVDQLFATIQQHKANQYIIVLAHSGSVKFFRAIRAMSNRRPIDISCEALESTNAYPWSEEKQQLLYEEAQEPAGLPINIPPHPRPMEKIPAFFECRSNQVFYIDKDGLDAQVNNALAASNNGNVRDVEAVRERTKAIAALHLENKYYSVQASYLPAGVMAIELKPGTQGNTAADLKNADSDFRKTLAALDPQRSYAVFLVRDDGIHIFHQSKIATEKLGFETGWELLAQDEPIKFGTGGSVRP